MGSHTQFSKLKSSKEAAACLPHQKAIGGETQHKARAVDTVVGPLVLQIVILVDHLVGVPVHQQVTRVLLQVGVQGDPQVVDGEEEEVLVVILLLLLDHQIIIFQNFLTHSAVHQGKIVSSLEGRRDRILMKIIFLETPRRNLIGTDL